jgi:acyl-CoA reductase-like NAD-dependent aldehyde dehydrogenase
MDRQRLFLRAADIVDRRFDEIAHILAIETGATSSFASFAIKWSSNLLRRAAIWGYPPCGEILKSDTPDRVAMVQQKPLGVAGSAPWNGAFNLAGRIFTLPMAFGNTIATKPSEEAGLIQAEIVEEARFPAGSLKIAHGGHRWVHWWVHWKITIRKMILIQQHRRRFDSAPGRHFSVRRRSLSSARVRRSGRTLVVQAMEGPCGSMARSDLL